MIYFAQEGLKLSLKMADKRKIYPRDGLRLAVSIFAIKLGIKSF